MSEPRFVEAVGPDVDTAIQNGLKKLDADMKDVIVEVLEESTKGFFGIGGRQAKVRLTLLAPPSRKQKPPTPAPKPAARKKARPAPAPEAELELAATPPAPDDELARVAEDTLRELLARMGIEDTRIEAYYVEAADQKETSPLVLQVLGRDLGTLIGRRGDTLSALQYITRLIVSRELQSRANIVVDVEHYKARREKRLRSLALRMAKQAVQRGRTVTLEPMPAYERRIIHLTLRDRTDVYTQSVGEGSSRKVTIVPVQNR